MRCALAVAAALLLWAAPALADDFSYLPPGDLTPGSGEGRVDEVVYAPGIRFPIESAPAFANSQVYGAGGAYGPGGGQCDDVNFSYPWRDNFCETRTWDMPLCPAGTGHQGQDVRAATCDKDTHWAVAAVDGTITNIGSYSVYLTADDGTRFDYLHMESLQVAVGDVVTRGQRVGRVSNSFNGTPTTVHLHFNVNQYVEGLGAVYVPPYTSLVAAYGALLGPAPGAVLGALESATCEGVTGFAWEPATPDAAAAVRVVIDGDASAVEPTILALTASESRDDLCASLGSCAHGFSTPLPLRLADGEAHSIAAIALDSVTGDEVPLDGGPLPLTCPLAIPAGTRRALAGTRALDAWHLSRLWDVVPVAADVLDAIAESASFPETPALVTVDGASVWVVDHGVRRVVTGETASAWGLDVASADAVTQQAIDSLIPGPPLRAAPYVLEGPSGELYVVDDALPLAEGEGGSASTGGSVDASASCSIGSGGAGRFLSIFLIALGLGASARRRRRLTAAA
jgi:murein DD-endopeptidase MepM/ murein hydrolase activator NlpD